MASTVPATSSPTLFWRGVRGPMNSRVNAQRGYKPVKIRPVDRRGLDTDEHLVGLRGRGFDVAHLDHLGRPVAVAHGRLHQMPAHRMAT